MNLSLSYTIDDAINAIKTYIDDLHIVNHSGVYSYSWPDGANPAGAPSGYIETYDPLRSQLGSTGAAWDTDYETHLEESTRAMMSPIVKLGSKIITDVLNRQLGVIIDDLIRKVESQVNPWIIPVTKSDDQAIVVDWPSSDTGWSNSFDHWPRMQLYTRIVAGSSNFIINLNMLAMHFFITEVASEGTYTINTNELFANNDVFGGYLIVW